MQRYGIHINDFKIEKEKILISINKCKTPKQKSECIMNHLSILFGQLKGMRLSISSIEKTLKKLETSDMEMESLIQELTDSYKRISKKSFWKKVN